MTNYDNYRELMNELARIPEDILTEQMLEEGFISDLWDKAKAFFGNNEAKGRVAIKTIANKKIKDFKQYVGKRRDRIKSIDDYLTFFYNFLVNEEGFDKTIVDKAAKAADISFPIKQPTTNTTDSASSDDSLSSDEEDLFKITDSFEVSGIPLTEAPSVNTSLLQKFMVILLTMSEEERKQPKKISDMFKQTLGNDYSLDDDDGGGDDNDISSSSGGNRGRRSSSSSGGGGNAGGSVTFRSVKDELNDMGVRVPSNLPKVVSENDFDTLVKDTKVIKLLAAVGYAYINASQK